MMKLIFTVFILQFGIVFTSTAVTVDLRSDETLKPFFDAGLRPIKVRGIVGQCEIGPTPMTLLLSDGKSVSFDVHTASITVDRHDRISGVQAVTRYLSLEEARQVSEIIHKELQKPIEPCLSYLEKVKANYIWPGAEYGIVSDTKPQIGLGFQGGESKERPLRIVFSLVWPREWKGVDRRREPIKPPPGYESVSMEPIPNPNVIKPEEQPPFSAVIPPPKKSPDAKGVTITEEPASTLWLVWAVFIVAALGLLWLVLKNRK